MRRLRFDYQINKSRIQTLKIHITILLEHCKNDCNNVPQCYLIIHHLSCFLFTGYITCLVFCLLDTSLVLFSVYWIHHLSCFLFTRYITCLVFCLLDTSLVLFSVYWIHHLSCFLFTGTARPAVETTQPPVGGHVREKAAAVVKK